jgi:hypothetical protein
MEMTKRLFSWTAIGLGSLALIGSVGCRATVAGDPDRPIKIEAHVTIDVRQIKEEARSIEDLVNSPAPKKSSRAGEWVVGTAWASLSPEVMEAVNSRRERVGQLKTAKGQGLIGEDNQGHVVVLGGGDEVRALAEQENRDRETIYQAQVKEKGLPADAIATIRAAFAEEQRDRADPGEQIQTSSGEWQTK